MQALSPIIRICPVVAALMLATSVSHSQSPQPAAEPAPPPHTRPPSILAWSPKPARPNPWVAPNKPHWQLSELLARHRGQGSWSQVVVSDRDFSARYISMALGGKTKTQFYADDRVFWVVLEGSIRVTIEGVEPFVATKGFLVQVPFRVPYSLATVGDSPSLRFEVTASRAVPLYPINETPTPVAGRQYTKVSISGHGQ